MSVSVVSAGAKFFLVGLVGLFCFIIFFVHTTSLPGTLLLAYVVPVVSSSVCMCSSHQTVLVLVEIQHTCPF